MKKIQISVVSLILVGGLFMNKVAAQEKEEKISGFYVDVNLGYGFSAGPQNFEPSVSTSTNSAGEVTRTDKVVKGSLGKGMRFGANAGYSFNGNIGAELGVNYLLGNTISSEQTTSSALSGYEFKNTGTQKLSARMLQLNPSIVLTTGNEGFTPYAKLGVVIGVAAKIKDLLEVKGTDLEGSTVSPVNISGEREFTGGIALGWSAAFGAKYALNETMSLFGEFNLINLTYAPTKGEVIGYTENGVDGIDGQNVSIFNFEYENEVTTNTSIPNSGNIELKKHYSFSSIGIQVGLKISF
jgi:opacity protein-like surface antigen